MWLCVTVYTWTCVDNVDQVPKLTKWVGKIKQMGVLQSEVHYRLLPDSASVFKHRFPTRLRKEIEGILIFP